MNPIIPVVIPKGTESRDSDTYTPTSTAALFTRDKRCKQSIYPTTDEQVKKCGIYIQWDIVQPKKEMN